MDTTIEKILDEAGQYLSSLRKQHKNKKGKAQRGLDKDLRELIENARIIDKRTKDLEK